MYCKCFITLIGSQQANLAIKFNTDPAAYSDIFIPDIKNMIPLSHMLILYSQK